MVTAAREGGESSSLLAAEFRYRRRETFQHDDLHSSTRPTLIVGIILPLRQQRDPKPVAPI
jgi:hypothetical protein